MKCLPRFRSLLDDLEKPPFDPLWYKNVHRLSLLFLKYFHKRSIFLASYIPTGKLDRAVTCPLSDKAMKETAERGSVRRLVSLSPTLVPLFSPQHCFMDHEASHRIWLMSKVMGHDENTLKWDQERVSSAYGSSLKFSTPQRSSL